MLAPRIVSWKNNKSTSDLCRLWCPSAQQTGGNYINFGIISLGPPAGTVTRIRQTRHDGRAGFFFDNIYASEHTRCRYLTGRTVADCTGTHFTIDDTGQNSARPRRYHPRAQHAPDLSVALCLSCSLGFSFPSPTRTAINFPATTVYHNSEHPKYTTAREKWLHTKWKRKNDRSYIRRNHRSRERERENVKLITTTDR